MVTLEGKSNTPIVGDFLVIKNDTNKPLTGLLSLIEPFTGDRSSTGKRLTGANVRRRRQCWRRSQPVIGGISHASYTFWKSALMVPRVYRCDRCDGPLLPHHQDDRCECGGIFREEIQL